MKCPKCNSALAQQSYHGIQVDACPKCKGMWLDLEELDQLEDVKFSVDEYKGSLVFSSTPTEYRCPHCDSPLKQFKYRLHNLLLEYCENQHGFWLDAQEEKRVLQLMKEREKNLKRKINAEAEWKRTLRRLKKKSLFDKLFG